MRKSSGVLKAFALTGLAAISLLAGISSQAALIDWTVWTAPGTSGNPGLATGIAGSTIVTYNGEVQPCH
jgi:hypothetical protein